MKRDKTRGHSSRVTNRMILLVQHQPLSTSSLFYCCCWIVHALCVRAYQMESSQRCCPFCFSYFDIEKDLRFPESSETCRNWSRFYKHSIERQWCPACGVLGWQWQRGLANCARDIQVPGMKLAKKKQLLKWDKRRPFTVIKVPFLRE